MFYAELRKQVISGSADVWSSRNFKANTLDYLSKRDDLIRDLLVSSRNTMQNGQLDRLTLDVTSQLLKNGKRGAIRTSEKRASETPRVIPLWKTALLLTRARRFAQHKYRISDTKTTKTSKYT